MELGGKVAVVTGGGSGIGRAMALAFAGEGMDVCVADIHDAAAKEVAGEVEALGRRAAAVACDVSQAAEVERLRDEAVAGLGAVHLVCNNAGVAVSGTAWETSVAEWERLLGVNLMGVVHGVRTFVPLFLEQGEGWVVNTGSMAGLTSAPGLSAYCVSKHGVVTLSEGLHKELVSLGAFPGVGVSVVCPGLVKTGLMEDPRSHTASTTVGQFIGEMLKSGVENGSPPSEVAAQVVEAVKGERFYVLTHPDMLPRIEERFAGILDGTAPR